MEKWIRLLKPVDGHAVGAKLKVTEAVSRAYIDAGLAEDAGDEPEQSIARDVTELLNEVRTAVAEEIRVGRTALATRPNVRIDAGESEIDRRRGVGDVVRHIFFADGYAEHKSQDLVRSGAEHLDKVYGIKRDMVEGTGSTGGFLTNTETNSQILEVATEDQCFLPRTQQVPLGAREVTFDALDQFRAPLPGMSATLGGIQVYRKTEIAPRTQSQPYFRRIRMVANDQTAYAQVSRDLLMDATADINAYVLNKFGTAIGWKNEWEAFNGDGNGRFLGVFQAPCTLQVARNTSGTWKYVDFASLLKRMIMMNKCEWYAHPYSIDTLLTIQDPSGRYIFQPSLTPSGASQLGVQPEWKIFGKPVNFSEKIPTLGNPGDLSLLTPSLYLNGTRSGMEMGVSDQFLFNTDEIAIRCKMRNDGQPQMKGPITLADGASLQSGFAMLI